MKTGSLPRHVGLRKGNLRPSKKSQAKRRKRAKDWAAVTREAIEACGGRCPVLNRPAVVGHHRLPRSQGGPDTIENCLAVSNGGHFLIHAEPKWAKSKGYLLTRADAIALGIIPADSEAFEKGGAE